MSQASYCFFFFFLFEREHLIVSEKSRLDWGNLIDRVACVLATFLCRFYFLHTTSRSLQEFLGYLGSVPLRKISTWFFKIKSDVL